MLDLRTIDELTRKLGESLPPGIGKTKDELERRFRTVLTAAFERMNLVTREQFDEQCELLEEARARLAALEQQIDAMKRE